MAYDAKYLRCPEIRWLGAFPSDSEKYCLPQQCLLPLTGKGKDATCAVSNKLSYACSLMLWSLIFFSDKRKTESMLNRCYLQRDVPKWR